MAQERREPPLVDPRAADRVRSRANPHDRAAGRAAPPERGRSAVCDRAVTIWARNVARRLRVLLYSHRKDPNVPVHPVERKIAAIFAADIACYSPLIAREQVC